MRNPGAVGPLGYNLRIIVAEIQPLGSQVAETVTVRILRPGIERL
jgi:hypothetical protein